MKQKSTLHQKMLFLLMLILPFTNLLNAQITQAPCNAFSPLITGTYPGVTVTSSQVLSLDDFAPKANLIDANLANSATHVFLLGESAYIEVKDLNATGANVFTAGTYAGFVISDNNLITILGQITVTTYLAGVQRESVTGGSLITANLFAGASRIGFITTQSFDQIRISFNGITVLGNESVYYAEIEKFCAGAALTCNVATTLTQPAYPVFIDPANTGITGVCALCGVINPQNVIDNNPANFAQIVITAGALGAGSIAVADQISTYPANTFAGFDIETASLLNANILGNITISLLNNGTVVQTGTGSSQLVTAGTSLLSGTPRSVVGIVSNVAFDEVKITLANTVTVDIGSTKVYGAVFQSGCAGTIGCNSTFYLNSPAYPVVIEGSRTGINTLACVACTVINPQNVITASNTDYGEINLTAGVFASGSISVRDMVTVYPAGTTTGFTVKDPNSFLQATLFNSITITTYLNGVQQQSKTGTQLINADLIVIFISPSTGVYNVGFSTNLPFNEVRITYSNVGGALTYLDVYSAFADTRFVPSGTPGFNCNYTNPDMNGTYVNVTVSGNVSTNDKIQPGTTYGTPTLPPGVTNPGTDFPVMNANGTYTFTPSAVGVYQFWVPVCLAGNCKNELLTITVLDNTMGVHQPPVANTDIATTKADVAVVIKTLENDKPGTPGSALLPGTVTLTDLNGAAAGNTTGGGTATVNVSNGDITYTPAAGFVGSDTIRYTVCDNQTPPLCASAYQIINVEPTSSSNNTVAADDYTTTPMGVAINGNVMINDSDPEGDPQTVVAQNTTITGKGTLVLNSDGTYTFTPVSGFSGSVEFAYTTCDNKLPQMCATATLHITVSGTSVLAVKLSAFNASVNNCNANIIWKSETEINLKNYVAEYSTNGVNFTEVATLNGRGNSNVYNVSHTPAQGKVYYRLKSVDLDGRVEYSRTIILNIACGKNSVFVYPNPANNVLNVSITGTQANATNAILYDGTGRMVLIQKMQNGSNQMNVSHLTKGSYTLRLHTATGTENMKVIIE